jgi:hypothetical protein
MNGKEKITGIKNHYTTPLRMCAGFMWVLTFTENQS